MFKPTSITNAIGLAILQESSIEAILKSRMGPKQPAAGERPYGGNGGQYKREMSKELEEKKAKGLCFKCNEKYTKGHVCNKKQLYVFEEEGEESAQDMEVEEEKEEEPKNKEELQISLNAITGSISYRTMRVRGNVKKKLLIILIDSGSTHNFLSTEVAKRASTEVEEIEPLPVVVVDGTILLSTAICRNFQWEMQGAIFQADVRLLQLKGCDMVLGIQWLATLGPVKWDFKNLSLEFFLKGRKHLLRGGRKEKLKLVGAGRMGKYLQKQP